MGAKPQRHSWTEAARLCRLNRFDVDMAKALGFRPDSVLKIRPGPKDKWKLPVREFVRDLYADRFGRVLGEEPVPAAQPEKVESDEEAMRRFEEELYWEYYHDRNS